MVTEALGRYPTTLEQDNELIDKDDTESMFTSNERNCVMYRLGEKIILMFLQTAAERFLKLYTMNQKDARKEINSYKGFEGCADYFRHTCMQLLLNPEGKQ